MTTFHQTNSSLSLLVFLCCTLAACQTTPSESVVQQTIVKEFSGVNLEGWNMVVGDGLYAAPGETPININDIETNHYEDASVLKANVQRRIIMAHNINYKPISDPEITNYIHTVGYEFKLPYLPSTPDPDQAGQTLEGGFFIWDGADTRLDYGAAFQWIVNPWSSDYGKIFTWRANEAGARFWQPVGFLQPDTNWHRVDINIDIRNKLATLRIDDTVIVDNEAFAQEVKPDFDNDVTGRLQAEVISVEPRPNNEIRRYHSGAFRNWYWQWQSY
jgi:hypothetical protein